MSIWTEQLIARAAPATVLDVLTDPRACGRWAPVDFELRALAGDRLRTGSRARVAGVLAGREVGFDVEVLAADEERLALVAHGPIALDVEYRLRAVEAGSELRAKVAVSGRGLGGRVLAQATGALLGAGALRAAMASIAHEAEKARARESEPLGRALPSDRGPLGRAHEAEKAGARESEPLGRALPSDRGPLGRDRRPLGRDRRPLGRDRPYRTKRPTAAAISTRSRPPALAA